MTHKVSLKILGTTLPEIGKGENAMGREVTFDYSKTASFISAEEVTNMKTAVMSAKEVLQEMIFLDGLTFQLIMTKRSLTELRKLLLKFRVIQMFFW